MQKHPTFLKTPYHSAAKVLAVMNQTSITNILHLALDQYAETLTGKQKEIYARAWAGETFDRWELKYLGKLSKKS